MELRIERGSESSTIAFAAEELAKYLRMMDRQTHVSILKPAVNKHFKNVIRLELTSGSALDDAYDINVKNGIGKISGSNDRSVLFGIYRYLKELGCRWPRAGTDGEIIPRRSVKNSSVKLREKASYRHRGVCIEGACSFEHVMNMVDWLPKAGMNSYFNQFSTPYAFFEHWYLHKTNPYMEAEPVTVEEVVAMVSVIEEQILKRGLLYHTTGHGWTCDPVGIPGNSWVPMEYKNLAPETRELLALVNGKREVFGGVALNTNLCFSNPKARKKIVNAIGDYCRERKEVDYLHFWLADAPNNHCECDNCKDTLPSDFYVKMLNEIDETLSKEKIPTKIVFLVYFDLMWEPVKEKFKNKDRFTLMFAPITRTYTRSFYEEKPGKKEVIELAPYVRNKLKMPKSVGENIERLSRWQKQFTGDAFDFDYHLIWDHNYDLGGYESARILFEDMKNLEKLKLNGMISCQVQRIFFPTALAMNAMASALWKKEQDFDQFAKSYFKDLFGVYGSEMQKYFKALSKLTNPACLRGEISIVSTAAVRNFRKIQLLVNEMLPKILMRYNKEADAFMKKTWYALTVHAQLCIYTAAALEAKAKNDTKDAEEKWSLAVDYINRMEEDIQDLLDVKYFTDVMGRVFRGRRRFESDT